MAVGVVGGGVGANVGSTLAGSVFFSGTLRIAVTGLDSCVIKGATGVGTSTFLGGFTGAGLTGFTGGGGTGGGGAGVGAGLVRAMGGGGGVTRSTIKAMGGSFGGTKRLMLTMASSTCATMEKASARYKNRRSWGLMAVFVVVKLKLP